MGPTRSPEEPASAFRLRWVVYCCKWLMVMAPALAMVVLALPRGDHFTGNFLTFFLLIGLTIGSCTALVAGIAYGIGAMWSAWLERSIERALGWQKFKLYFFIAIHCCLMVFSLYWLYQGLFNGHVLGLTRRVITISYEDHPVQFVMALVFWACMPVFVGRDIWRKLRTKRPEDMSV